MKTNILFGHAAAFAVLTLAVACSGGGSGASGGGGGAGGGGGGAGGGAGGNASGGGGNAGTTLKKSGDITANETWTKENLYVLEGTVFVAPGVTLTIEAGTTVSGTQAPSLGTLVISPGAKLEAAGTADEPIVFTSLAPPGSRLAGDWGGLILLGKAPINAPGGTANIEGLEVGPKTTYGGDEPEDDSGTLQYVRIEFSGGELSQDNEINGLTLGGVGAGTTLEHIMVHKTLDDCFEFFGGTVNAKYLICADNGDDGFDWDFGYSGKLQFLALRQDPTVADTANGFEGDNDADGSLNTPISAPIIYNATLCGQNVALDKQQFGILVRRSSDAHIFNTIVTGFEAGVDFRNAVGDVEVAGSIFFGNTAANLAYAETVTDASMKDLPTFDDDAGYDEAAELLAAGNVEADPKLGGCFAATPDFLPLATLSAGAATPPNDGFFDASASYVGAFAAGDDWATGAWVSFAEN